MKSAVIMRRGEGERREREMACLYGCKMVDKNLENAIYLVTARMQCAGVCVGLYTVVNLKILIV